MLDKSIEFHSIIMKNHNKKAPLIPSVPEGFFVRFYEDGDENSWAEIQTSVSEFENCNEALSCFQHYLNFKEELKKKQIYIIDSKKGIAVATATAWFSEMSDQKIGVVHALSCLPQYQSLGLGRIAASYMMDCFYRLMPGCDVWLDTQTWSYKAIGIYLDLGFVPLKTATYNEVPNEYEDAVQVLKGKMREDKHQKLVLNAEC